MRNIRKSLVGTAVVCGLAVSLVGCDLLSSAAQGDDIGSDDVVRAAEDEHDDYEQRQEDIEETVDAINQTLEEIQENRQAGQFRAAEYREDNLDRQLDTLEDLDDDHAMLEEAPAELERIEAEYTREDYERKALAEECEDNVETARTERMNEQWRRVDNNLDAYVKCRRQLVDMDGDADQIGEMDDLYETEIDEYANYLLEQIEEQRRNDNFRHASSNERNLENHLEYLQEVGGDEQVIADAEDELEEVRETYRDPQVVEAEQAEDAFEQWRDRALEAFNDEMDQIQEAEEEARPIFEEGKELMDEGNLDEALAKFEEARETLYENAYTSGVAMETAVTNRTIELGLSYEIASAIAEVYFQQGDRSKMYPELSIIRDGRPWFDDDEEFEIRLHQILADRDEQMAPQPTDQVRRYAGEFSDTADEFRRANERAEARSGESYAMLGVNLDPISERALALDADDATGEVIHLEEEVSSVSGGQIRFDFRETRTVAHNCRSTGEVAGANVYTGEVRYQQECDEKEVEEGYVLSAPNPGNAPIQSGDTVELYATVGDVGDETVSLNDPGVVRVMSEGETSWYLGVSY